METLTTHLNLTLNEFDQLRQVLIDIALLVLIMSLCIIPIVQFLKTILRTTAYRIIGRIWISRLATLNRLADKNLPFNDRHTGPDFDLNTVLSSKLPEIAEKTRHTFWELATSARSGFSFYAEHSEIFVIELRRFPRAGQGVYMKLLENSRIL
jgi:hypothetical protein